MATPDTRGNLHARDGKFTEKQHTADEVTLTPSSVPNSASEMYKKMVRDRIEKIATDLEDMAAEIRHAARTVDTNAVASVADVVHKLAWGQANLGVSGLLQDAGNVQTAEAYEKAQTATKYTDAIEGARTIEYPDAGAELRGSNGAVVYDTDALEAARKHYRGE
ncbi:hypothetical protein [Curtobacterium sp. MCSS17_016]|uniref:hypothetical protein n=1 Tax=Curtobacterium sp. MCSS17_016 TaxID=2175644 RepID=UPI0011B5FF8D|nr:hypothetical protein [Curtobacterium sp. MCSS17_016]WIE81028.1 hypothetical protein DEJ19_021160 [Curtobacterium sp. MCSS17_016]